MGDIQQRITRLMSERKINAVDIEKETGLNRNTVYSILAGRSKNPSAYNLHLIATALGVPLEAILIDEEITPVTILSNEQMKVFANATHITIDTIIAKKMNFPLTKLIPIIKEVHHYALKSNPPQVDEKFTDWILDKDKH